MDSDSSSLLAKFQEVFFTFQIDEIVQKGEVLISSGCSPHDFLAVCKKCMDEVGKRFEEGEYFLPELVVAGEAFKLLTARIRPSLSKDNAQGPTGSIVVGTPKGDIHSLGKDIFCTLAEAVGMSVYNLGEDVPPQAFINKVRETGARVVGMSALITTAYPSMQEVIRMLEESGLREQVKVVIGGGATTKELALKLGADAQTWDAYEGIRIVQSFFPEQAVRSEGGCR